MRFFEDEVTETDEALERQCDDFLKSYGVDPAKFNGADICGRYQVLEEVPDYFNEFYITFYQKGRKPISVQAHDLDTNERYKALIFVKMKLDFNDIRKKKKGGK